jgi:hypothetical protein
MIEIPEMLRVALINAAIGSFGATVALLIWGWITR